MAVPKTKWLPKPTQKAIFGGDGGIVEIQIQTAEMQNLIETGIC